MNKSLASWPFEPLEPFDVRPDGPPDQGGGGIHYDTLKKIKVGYETYTKWKESLKDHCTILTGFYPGGYSSYVVHFFLLDSDHESVFHFCH